MASPSFESARNAIFTAIEIAITAGGDDAETARVKARALAYEAVKGQPLPEQAAQCGEEGEEVGHMHPKSACTALIG